MMVPPEKLERALALADIAHRARMAAQHYQSGASHQKALDNFNAAASLMIDELKGYSSAALTDATLHTFQTSQKSVD